MDGFAIQLFEDFLARLFTVDCGVVRVLELLRNEALGDGALEFLRLDESVLDALANVVMVGD